MPADRREAAPELVGDSLDGRPLRLADHRGEVVLLNAWASWCGPCRAEAPELRAAHEHLAARGVRVIGLDADSDPARGRAFQREQRLGYPSFRDPSGRQLLRFPKGTVPQGVPFTVVIDTRGRIAAVHAGPVTERELRDLALPLTGS
ncbi:TlpA disulfide reductase family protein [Streptomyces cellostaticus]|uniref:TlpA family protein disulfide reductase n=1 Tax=Streptomyces TaxID=1883 RepID=UPI0020276949|nr:TlpA disulfide reductase family protein [Streptomyces cellostaticus]